jgi:Protein of unknown function (DUF2924)
MQSCLRRATRAGCAFPLAIAPHLSVNGLRLVEQSMPLRNTKVAVIDESNPLTRSEHWRTIFRCDSPKRIREVLQSALLAQGVQEERLGSTYRALDRQLQLAISTSPSNKPSSSVGTRLIRSWGGVNHEVIVLPKGFSYRGAVHRSLSEIARLITGTRWSGPRFFGLKDQERP